MVDSYRSGWVGRGYELLHGSYRSWPGHGFDRRHTQGAILDPNGGTVSAATVMVISKATGQRSVPKVNASGEYNAGSLAPGEVEQFVERTTSRLNFRTALIDGARTMKSFLRMHRAIEYPSSELERDHTILVFLHELAARHGTTTIPFPCSGIEDSAVRQSKQFLDKHFADPVLLRDLARITGLSPYHLNRSFCRKIGMPPHAYQLQLRIAQAKSALRMGSPIARVALATGFADQSHFTRVFKRLVGNTPGQYCLNSKNVQNYAR